MKSGKSSSNWAVFGHAAWHAAIDMASDGKTRTELVLWPSSRLGVFVWEARSHRLCPDGAERVVCRVQAEFPNSRAETLEAFLYSLMTRLMHCVDAHKADEAARGEKAGRRS